MNADDALHVHDSAGARSDSPDGYAAVGISQFLPYPAAAALVRAARQARQLPPGSTARALVVRDAIRKVRVEFPRYFRQGDDCRQ